MSFHRICILVFALALFGCAQEKKGGEPSAGVPSDGKIEGTLTINGESHSLKCVYAGCNNRICSGGERRVASAESKTLKGSTLKALYFTQYESIFLNGTVNQTGRASFDGTLMTSASFFQHGSVRFEAPNFKNGILRAKVTNEFAQSFPGEDYQNIKMVAKYSLSFEAKIRSESLLSRSVSIENKAFQESLASLPEPGKAQGSQKAVSFEASILK